MTLSLTPGAMTRRLRAARLGVIRSYALAEGALRVYAYGTDEARAISAHLIQLGYDAVATGDRVTVTLPEPVEEEAPAPRITTREELIASQVARGVTPERAAMIAAVLDALQAELTATAPAIAAALDDSHLGPEVDDSRDEPAPLDPREVVVPAFGSPGWALSLLPENRHSDRRDDLTVTVVDGFRPHVDTTVRCLGCGQLITVNVDGDTECGGAGEGTCDALDGHAGPVEDSHHDAADAAHDALLGYQLAHEARA